FRLNGQNNLIYGVEVTDYAAGFDNPGNAAKLIDDITAHLLPKPIEQAQKDYLKSKLLGTFTEAQWTAMWNAYIADPSNTQTKTAVENRLRPMLIALNSMPEYHLS
ncbi:MAG TPA: hypothetical protein PKK64_05600, partial [Saprospiraceae bacterium]|nr:hypothetical protein [Saprospiraceae bacterium]